MMKRRLVRLACATVLLAGLAVPSMASASDEDDTTGIQLSLPATTIPDTAAEDAAIKAQLEALAGTQTPDEIAAIMEGPNYALGDENGVTVAAIAKPATIGVRAISIRGPGCAVGDACANNVNGYYGTGWLNLNLSGITKVASGNKNTTWWFDVANSKGYNLTANTTYLADNSATRDTGGGTRSNPVPPLSLSREITARTRDGRVRATIMIYPPRTTASACRLLAAHRLDTLWSALAAATRRRSSQIGQLPAWGPEIGDGLMIALIRAAMPVSESSLGARFASALRCAWRIIWPITVINRCRSSGSLI